MNKSYRIHRYLFVLTISILVASLLLPGCGDGGAVVEEEEIAEEEEEVASTVPELIFRRYSPMVIHSPTYGEEGEEVYGYFEVTGGSGEVEITVDISQPDWVSASNTASFSVEEGVYQLAIVVYGIGAHYNPTTPGTYSAWEVEFSLSSPSASAEHSISVLLPIHSQSYGLEIGAMTIESWTPPETEPEQVWNNFDLTLIRQWGSLGSDPGEFEHPEGVAADEAGLIYVLDSGMRNCGVQVFSPSGEFIREWVSYGGGDGEFMNPKGIALDSEGSIYVVEASNSRVQVFTSTGQFLRKWGSRGTEEGQFTEPKGVAVGEDGEVYVADTSNDRVQVFTSEGDFLRQWQVESPYAITVEGDGNLYILSNNRVKLFNRMGELLREWGSEGSDNGQFDSPRGIAVDAAGNIYVVDTGNRRLQVFDDSGELLYIWKWGGLINYCLHGVAIDYTGNLIVTHDYGVKIFLPESLQ